MRTIRPWPLLLAIGVVLSALAFWGLLEARQQKREVEDALAMQATLLARSLGPGLAASSSAARELEEVITWRLLDNAHLLARLHEADALSAELLADAIERSDLDSAAVIDRDGAVILQTGAVLSDSVLAELGEITGGAADELILGSTLEDGVEHLGVAVATGEGGAVCVQVHKLSVQTLARRIGVENLLRSLVDSAGVLYLAYSEEPGGIDLKATWDDGPIPQTAGAESTLRQLRGRRVFEVQVAVDSLAGTNTVLRVGLDGEPLKRAAAAATRRWLLAGILLAGFGASLAAFAVVSRARTIERAEAARKVAEAEESRRRGERLAAAGTLTAGLAHEVRSPLNAIGLAAQRIERRHADGKDCSEFAGRIRGEVRRLEGILREFLDFARPVSGAAELTELHTLTGEVIGLLGDEASQEQVRLEAVAGGASAVVDREALRRSLINLLRNAIQASPSGGTVRTLVEQSADTARIRVSDEGPGIEPGMEEKVFEAFFTTRASGSGLGLALVRRVAREHGGDCSMRRLPQGGSEVTLELPRAGGESEEG